MLLAIMLITLDIASQENQKEALSNDFKKNQIGATISSDYCYRTLK